MRTITFRGKIMGSVAMTTGAQWGILDYFLTQHGKEIAFYDQERILEAVKGGKFSHQDFLQAMQEGKFQKIAQFKQNMNPPSSLLIKTAILKDKAYKTLSQSGGSSNQGLIFQHFANQISGEPYLPASSIKGMIRTAYLLWLYEEKNFSLDELENLHKKADSRLSQLFSNILVSDVKLDDYTLAVQEFSAKRKNEILGGRPKRAISQIVESVIKGNFQLELHIQDTHPDMTLQEKLREFIDNIDAILRNYSLTLLDREEIILEYLADPMKLTKNLDRQREEGWIALKCGKNKKSLSYKLDREGELEKIAHLKGQNWLKESRKAGVGDKILYFDEEENPVGRIILQRQS